MATNVGIRGLGYFLPPELRRNEWWDPRIVASWQAAQREPPGPPPELRTEGQRLVARAMANHRTDPFRGAIERHILSDDMSPVDMEERAAREAIARAGVDPSEIDLLLTYRVAPDYLLSNPACEIHARLGLQPACFSMHTDVSSYAFLMQLTMAEAMICAGRARCALLIQSCAASRLLDMTDEIAPYFGDAATAAVVGRVSAPHGIEAAVHFTDGRFLRTLCAGVPGARWYDEGRAKLHLGDARQMQQLLLDTADWCKESVNAVLAKASRTPDEAAFVCIHQGTPWLRTVVLEYLALPSARSVETFTKTGYVFASTLPLELAIALDQGLLRDGDVVVLTGGGTGMTFGSLVLRWGT
jgi:3-oxoacyl-[acyl-carrier-protein] synthase-3